MGDGLYLRIPVAEYDELMKCKEFVGSIVRCKDCKYFELDHFEKLDGFPIPLIVAHEICTKWSKGCKTSSEGFCFMGERKDGEQDENRV